MSREIVVFGAAGYSGLELLRILVDHPAVRVVAASSSKWCGERIDRRVPRWSTDLVFVDHEDAMRASTSGRIALLATPAEASLELAPELIDRGLRVVDLSGAFRLRDAALYPKWYGFDHPRPDLLQEAHYGLVDLVAPSPEARLVANPGCYATAAILGAAPLVVRGLVRDDVPLVVDGKSGTTGAGRKASEALLHAEVAENMRPYRLSGHQHTPEIEQALSRLAGRTVMVSFTAHLVPMRRGIIASIYAPSSPSASQEACHRAYTQQYEGSRLVRYLGSSTPPETGAIAHTNFVDICSVFDARTGAVSAYSAIDNLVKGAAGQAIENLNLLLGLPKETGLV
ncbi:MAG: N-acetyl-gamma-glutamyl-phosphate reductase [Deltaproteobacteria bacterium]|nr:N-acetyl-gamma-glutamyl-phosphate reductase [Deltaproteobacteria bacterium]